MDALRPYENKEIWYCSNMGRRLNFNSSTISLCHEAQVGDVTLMKVSELTPEKYYLAVRDIIDKANADDSYPCRSCSKCTKEEFKLKQIDFVTICTSSYCNSNCIYCTGHFGIEGSGYNPIPYLEMFHQQNLFSQKCYFDWGGGEPTLNPYYEAAVNWLHQHKYYQRFNTNAILFSEMTYEALKDGKGGVRVSVDSGTKEVFALMKGTDKYDEVWSNIARYASASSDVHVKYNICNYNSDQHEIDAFIDMCLQSGVKSIIIDAEISAYQPENNAGPFYFTQKELDAAKYMEAKAKASGLNVRIGGYAFSVRGEYDADGNLKLPEQYFDNVNKNIISNGIKANTFPTVRQLIDRLSRHSRLRVVVMGDGDGSEALVRILTRSGVKHKRISVISNNKVAKAISFAKESLRNAINGDVHIILVGDQWKQSLQIVNKLRLANSGNVHYMPDVHYLRFNV